MEKGGQDEEKAGCPIPESQPAPGWAALARPDFPRGRGRGPAGSGVVRGALSGLRVGAPHLGRGARTQAPAGLGTCLGSEGSKRLRLGARVPRNDQTLPVGARRGVRGAAAACPPRHGADALPAECPPGEPLAQGPYVPRAPRPAAVRGRLLPLLQSPGHPGSAASGLSELGRLGGLGAQATGQSCPPQPLSDTGAVRRHVSSLTLLGLCVSWCPTPFSLRRRGALRVPGVTAWLIIPNANNRPPAAAGR